MKLLPKLTIMPILTAALCLSSCGKGEKTKDHAPEKVKTAFTQKFPEATEVNWGKESDTEWEADFKMGGKTYSANFSADGQWIETEYEMAAGEIPATIQTNIDSVFAGYTIEKVELSEKATGKLYEIEMEKGENSVEAVYDVNGVLVKQVNEEEEEKGEKEEKEEDEKKEEQKTK